jgi:hypothetical protein
MAHHYEVLRYTEHRKMFVWLSETEKFLNNLESLRRTSLVMRERTRELKTVLEEIEFNLADTRSIRAKLNQTAIQVGLQPLPAKRPNRRA